MLSPLPSPMLTLVIPAYNRGHLIGQTLESALRQTQAFAAIVVVDDGSSDHTAEVLADFAAQIQIIQTPNRGVQAARNTGIEWAATEYVTLCDSDDLLEPHYVETMTQWLMRHPDTDMVFCNFTLFNAQGSQGHKLDFAPVSFLADLALEDGGYPCIPDLYRRMLDFQPLFPTGCTFKKSFCTQLGGFNPAFNRVGGEDWEFTLRAVLAGQVALHAAPLARVRKHNGNDSANTLYMLRGEITILEYSLAYHPQAARYRPAIEASVHQRRLLAFDAAYAQNDRPQLHAIFQQLQQKPATAKFWLKYLIFRLPSRISQMLWKLTQR